METRRIRCSPIWQPRNRSRVSAKAKIAALNKFANANNKKFGDKAYIKWNFTKFLIDREGNVIARFEPTVDMEEVRKAVAAAL